MYKAIKEIGEYKVGDEVPTEKAEAWLKMYSEPHVELSEEKPIKVKEKIEEPEKKKKVSKKFIGRRR